MPRWSLWRVTSCLRAPTLATLGTVTSRTWDRASWARSAPPAGAREGGMAINIELAAKAEREARRICRERGWPEAVWHRALMEAYDRITACAHPTDRSESDA